MNLIQLVDVLVVVIFLFNLVQKTLTTLFSFYIISTGIVALIEALKINEDVLHMNVHSNHFNLQSPPHARELEDQIEALLHGHAFHHFHTSGEVEDTSNEQEHTEHPLKHIERHQERVLKEGKTGKGGIDSHHGEPGHKMTPINRNHDMYEGNGPPAAVHSTEL